VARIVVPIVIVMLLAAGGYYVWKRMNTYESTDDAQIDGHINSISARISGNVIQAPVEDQTVVKAGDVLVRIDPKDYEVAVSKAQADLADAEAALLASRADVPIISTNTASQLKTARSTRVDASAALLGAQRQLDAAQARLESAKAQVREAEANYKKARDDVARYKQLVDKDEIPRQQYDTAVSTAEAFKATLDARQASVAEAEQNIRVAQSLVEQANARLPQADASIQAAMTAPQQVAVSEARAKSAQAQVAQKRALLEQAKLKYFGGGRNLADAHRPLVIESHGLRIAVLGYNEFQPRSFEAGESRAGVAWSVDEQVVEDIKSARSKAAHSTTAAPATSWSPSPPSSNPTHKHHHRQRPEHKSLPVFFLQKNEPSFRPKMLTVSP